VEANICGVAVVAAREPAFQASVEFATALTSLVSTGLGHF